MKQVYGYPQAIYGTNNYVGEASNSIFSTETAMRGCPASVMSSAISGTTISSQPISGLATGAAYVFTAGMLLVPFIFIVNPFLALGMTYVVAISVIFFFNYVKSRLCHEDFWPRFFEMLTICGVVTVTAFLIGEAAKFFFGVEI